MHTRSSACDTSSPWKRFSNQILSELDGAPPCRNGLVTPADDGKGPAEMALDPGQKPAKLPIRPELAERRVAVSTCGLQFLDSFARPSEIVEARAAVILICDDRQGPRLPVAPVVTGQQSSQDRR